MKHPIFLLGISLLLAACHNNATMISEQHIQSAITTVLQAHPTADSAMLARGAKQVAALWRESDGTETDYQTLIASSNIDRLLLRRHRRRERATLQPYGIHP